MFYHSFELFFHLSWAQRCRRVVNARVIVGILLKLGDDRTPDVKRAKITLCCSSAAVLPLDVILAL